MRVPGGVAALVFPGLLVASAAFADPLPYAAPRAHTFSIVARDSTTGELGVAVQSHWFSVGSIVPWAEPGVGAVATQSFAEPAYGPRGLALMRSGLPAEDALCALVGADPAEAVRQVAFVDASGRIAVHTGAKCIASAGHETGPGFSVQVNLMINDAVVPAMAKAYRETRGDLAERLVTALEAAQAAGGDIRGRQSAALLIVKGKASGKPWTDRVVDLRVDDHPDPVVEIRRLLTVHRAYDEMNRGDLAVEKGDMTSALAHYSAAARSLPENVEIRFWQGVTLATNGRVDEAIPVLTDVFAHDPNWIEVARRLQPSGIIPSTPDGNAILARILSEAGPAR